MFGISSDQKFFLRAWTIACLITTVITIAVMSGVAVVHGHSPSSLPNDESRRVDQLAYVEWLDIAQDTRCNQPSPEDRQASLWELESRAHDHQSNLEFPIFFEMTDEDNNRIVMYAFGPSPSGERFFTPVIEGPHLDPETDTLVTITAICTP